MLSLNEIKRFYPERLHPFGSFLIREYLQYKILDIIHNTDAGKRLVFMGGTCLRLIYDNRRFSEDLDFDNQGLSENEFSSLSSVISKALQLEGYEVEITVIHRGAFHCKVRFPGLLFQEGLSGHKEENILIQIDTEPQEFNYIADKYILNKFDVFTEIRTTPKSILLAQKIYAILNRKRNKGRDYYDVSYLLGLDILPDWLYLERKTGISNNKDLKSGLITHCENTDMKKMAKDVEPFLFDPKGINRVVQFLRLIDQVF
jgi:predicted nucleotidyltransferase component of viral defense system